MHHPFISDLSDKSLDELQKKITELNNKLSFSFRVGNGPLIQQIQMALESYKSEYNKRMDELMKKQKINSKVDIKNERKNF
jgi:hypothetical protein